MTNASSDIIEDLIALGFSAYQAKTYAGLISLGGRASAPEISKASGVPKARIYDVLEELGQYPLLAVSKIPTEDEGRTEYQAEMPATLIERLLKEKNEIAERLLSALNPLILKTKIDPPRLTMQVRSLGEADFEDARVIVVRSIEESRIIRKSLTERTRKIPIVENLSFPPGIAIILKQNLAQYVQLNPIGSSEIISFHSPSLVEFFRAHCESLRPLIHTDPLLQSRGAIVASYALELEGQGQFAIRSVHEPLRVLLTTRSFETIVHGSLDLSIPLPNIRDISFENGRLSFNVFGADGNFLGSIKLVLWGGEEFSLILKILLKQLSEHW